MSDTLSFEKLLNIEIDRLMHAGEFSTLGTAVQATINIAKDILNDEDSFFDVVINMITHGGTRYTMMGHPYNLSTVCDTIKAIVDIKKEIDLSLEEIKNLFREDEYNNLYKKEN